MRDPVVAGGLRVSPRGCRVVGRRASSVALLTGVALLAGCGIAKQTGSTQATALVIPQTPPLALTSVFHGTVRSTVDVSGQVVSLQTARLYFHNGGTVAAVHVTDGQAVAKGEILASLDTGDLPYQIQDARLTVRNDELNLEKMAVSSTPATTSAEAAAQVIQQHQATLALAQDRVTLRSEELTLAEDEVVAPFSGQVNDVSVAPGDQVGGFQTVMTLSNPADEAFVAQVGQTTAQIVRPGQQAILHFNAGSSAAYPATVHSVFIPSAAQIAQAETNGVNPPRPQITLTVQRVKGRPALGATFTATITRAEALDVLYVPTDAIRQFNGFTYVDVLRHGAIVEEPVQVGLQGDTTTVVTKGLAAGEQVVEP